MAVPLLREFVKNINTILKTVLLHQFSNRFTDENNDEKGSHSWQAPKRNTGDPHLQTVIHNKNYSTAELFANTHRMNRLTDVDPLPKKQEVNKILQIMLEW